MVRAYLAFCCAAAGFAQTTPPTQSANAASYHYPTGEERLHHFARDTFGLIPLAEVAASASITQLTNSAPEWGQGAQGYGIRVADQFGKLLISNTINYAAATALHQDIAYQRCQCTGLLRRTGHAVVSTFIARRPDGGKTFAVSRLMGDYGAGIIATYWYPNRYSPLGDGVRFGNFNVMSDVGINIAREFLPQIRKKILRH